MKKEKNVKHTNRKFTAIDLLICFIVLFTVVYVGIRFFKDEVSTKTPNVEMKVNFVLKEELKDSYKIGDVILTSDGKNVIGTVKDVSVSPATEKTLDIYPSKGNDSDFSSEEIVSDSSDDITVEVAASLAETEESMDNTEVSEEDFSSENDDTYISEDIYYDTVIEGYVSVTLTCEMTLHYESGRYYINDSIFKVGDEIEITTKDFSSFGKCISLSEKTVKE